MTTVVLHAVADDAAWDPWSREHLGAPYLRDWLAAHGIDWALCLAFDVVADGDGHIVATMCDADHTLDSDGMHLLTEEITVPLRAPIPAELRR